MTRSGMRARRVAAACLWGVGALVSIAVGTMLVLAGRYSVLSAPQNSVVATPTVPVVLVAPSPSATSVKEYSPCGPVIAASFFSPWLRVTAAPETGKPPNLTCP